MKNSVRHLFNLAHRIARATAKGERVEVSRCGLVFADRNCIGSVYADAILPTHHGEGWEESTPLHTAVVAARKCLL